MVRTQPSWAEDDRGQLVGRCLPAPRSLLPPRSSVSSGTGCCSGLLSLFPQPGPHPLPAPHHCQCRPLPLPHFLAAQRGRSEDFHVTDGEMDFEDRYTWLSCLVIMTPGESCHVLEPPFPPLHEEDSRGFLENCQLCHMRHCGQWPAQLACQAWGSLSL